MSIDLDPQAIDEWWSECIKKGESDGAPAEYVAYCQLAKEVQKFEALAQHADKFEDGIDWVQRALQAEAKLEAWKEDARRYASNADFWRAKVGSLTR